MITIITPMKIPPRWTVLTVAATPGGGPVPGRRRATSARHRGRSTVGETSRRRPTGAPPPVDRRLVAGRT